ncbi:MAG: DUF805 domain-containing protein [Steroidobacteraceae bacterium]
MNWYLEVLKKYAVFHGRARRKEYWYFILLSSIISTVLTIVDSLSGTFNSASEVGLLGGIYLLATLVPSLAVTVRRLHDTGRSGWWILLGLVPVVGVIMLIVFLALDGSPQDNDYGTNPQLAATMPA